MAEVVRIAVFYDGSYFFYVSNYYRFNHVRQSRIDLAGLRSFIQNRVSGFEQVDQRLCQIVEAHYFRGRFSVRDMDQEAERDNDPDYAGKQLRNERAFDDVLMRANIATHTERSERRTSQLLINECSYPIMMHEEIDNRARQRDPLIDGLFVAEVPYSSRPAPTSAPTAPPVQVAIRRRP